MITRRDFLKRLGITAAVASIPGAAVAEKKLVEAVRKAGVAPIERDDIVALTEEYWYLKWFYGSEQCMRLPMIQQQMVRDRYYELHEMVGQYADAVYRDLPGVSEEVAKVLIQHYRAEGKGHSIWGMKRTSMDDYAGPLEKMPWLLG